MSLVGFWLIGLGGFGGVFFSFWHCSETEYTVGFKSIAENTEYTFFMSQVRLRDC